MQMTGHVTESVYRRYAIVDEAMLREAGAKLAAAGIPAGQASKVTPGSGKVVKLER
jgi:hypothetical protein